MSINPFTSDSLSCPKCGSHHLIYVLENQVEKNRYRASCGNCGCVVVADSWDEVYEKLKLGKVSVEG